MRKCVTLLVSLCSLSYWIAMPTIVNAGEETVKLIQNIKPAVVLIQTFDSNSQPIGQGSGFFIDNKGSIITNHHVIEGAYSATIKTSAGKEYPVQGIVAKDTEADIVKLSVNITDSNISFLKLSTSIPAEGEDVIVIGNPLGLESSVSTGIVSSVRDIPAFGKILQITAAVSAGSSGSPVLNSKGEVIGIATLILTEGQNLNFAIPSDKIIALKETPKTQISEAQTSYDFEKYHDKIFTVVNVVDGGTIDIDVPDGEYEHTRISLWGIDTPETQSPQTGVTYFGPEAAAFTQQLVLGRKVTIYLDTENRTRNKYGRLLAYVQSPDGRFLNEVLLAEGFAYADMRFKHTFYHKYQQLEATARSQRKGLWANIKADKISNEFTTDENDHNSDAAKSFLYHNSEGHFSFTLPAGWQEIQKSTIEAYFKILREKAPDISSMNCDGGFQRINATYFAYPYILFVINKQGRWPEKQIKQFLTSDEWENGMQEGLRTAEKQLSGLIQNVKSGQRIYDKKRDMFISKFESEVVGIGEVIGLTFTIPSNYGCINLYCYSTKDSFENDLPYFTQMIDSFRYDIGYEYNQFTKNKSNYAAEKRPRGNLLSVGLVILICGALVTLVVIIVARKSSRRSNNFQETLQTSVQPSTSGYLSSFGEESTQMVLASSWQRFGNMLLDAIFYYILAFIFGIVLYLIGLGDLIQNMNENILGIIILIIYYVPQEAFSGRTLGKFITGTKAVNEDGSNLTFGRALGRTLCRFIPFEAFSFLGGKGMPRGWHDRIPKTKVISLRRTSKVAAPNGDVL